MPRKNSKLQVQPQTDHTSNASVATQKALIILIPVKPTENFDYPDRTVQDPRVREGAVPIVKKFCETIQVNGRVQVYKMKSRKAMK